MKTTTAEISAELGALESQVTVLETQARACGLTIPTRPDVTSAKLPGATLDEMFTATAALESHAAKLRVGTRLATPLSSVHGSTPKASTSTSATRLTPTQQLAAGGGAKVMGLKSEIEKLENLLPGFTKGSASARAAESRIASLRGELSRLTTGK